MQDLTGCDYFRTPAIFQGVDIYRFVGDIHDFVPGSISFILVLCQLFVYFLNFLLIPTRQNNPEPKRMMVTGFIPCLT
jgi:hypothetical protein